MKKKPVMRMFTSPLNTEETEDVPTQAETMKLTRQLSIMGGGSMPSSPQVKKACRLVVLGSTQTGKTCIVNRFLNGTFEDSYLPTIENFHRKLYKIHSEFYQLDILDTSGNDPFPAARRLSLLTGDMFLLVFSIDHPGSCDEALRLREQIMEIKEDCHGASMSEKLYKKSFIKSNTVPIVIAANKLDLPKHKHLVNLEDVRSIILQHHNCAFVECSAKDNLNIDELFYKLFHLAKLPKQMSPTLHRHVCLEKSLDSALINTPGSVACPKKLSLVRLRSKNSEPTLVFTSDAKRPSLRTDLLSLKIKNKQSVVQLSSTVSNKAGLPTSPVNGNGGRKPLTPQDSVTSNEGGNGRLNIFRLERKPSKCCVM